MHCVHNVQCTQCTECVQFTVNLHPCLEYLHAASGDCLMFCFNSNSKQLFLLECVRFDGKITRSQKIRRKKVLGVPVHHVKYFH